MPESHVPGCRRSRSVRPRPSQVSCRRGGTAHRYDALERLTAAKVKTAASGYKVSNIRERCYNGGSMGKECIIRAKLCN